MAIGTTKRFSVKCRFCGTIWTDEAEFSKQRIGDQACPARNT